MKKLYYILLGFTLLSLAACKKDDDDNDPPPTQNNVPPAVITASQPGYISVSASALIINKNATGTITVKLFDSNGNLINPQPSFQFASSNNAAASVDGNGTVTGLSEGVSNISVTDGTHGFAFATVTVVSDTIVVTTDPVSIDFATGLLNLNVGASANFNYNLLDASGNVMGGVATLTASPSGGITISGNTITANQMGVYYITATNSNNDTISGALMVVVNDPNAPSNINSCSGTDADWEVLGVRMLNVPWFAKAGLTAEALRVEVTRRKLCGNHDIEVIQRSPDAITLGLPGVVNLSSDGRLQSVKAGISTVVATVGGVNSLTGGSMVMPHIEGSYIYSGSLGGNLTSATINLGFSPPAIIVGQPISQNNQVTFSGSWSWTNRASVTGCGTVGNDEYRVVGLGATYVLTYPDCNYDISNGGVYFTGFDCGNGSQIDDLFGIFELTLLKANPITVYDYVPIGIYADLQSSGGNFTVYEAGTSNTLGSLAPGGDVNNCPEGCWNEDILTSKVWTGQDGGVTFTLTFSSDHTFVFTEPEGSGTYNWSASDCSTNTIMLIGAGLSCSPCPLTIVDETHLTFEGYDLY